MRRFGGIGGNGSAGGNDGAGGLVVLKAMIGEERKRREATRRRDSEKL